MFDCECAPMVRAKTKEMWLRASALVAMTCLFLNVLGCAGVQPATKADGDSGSSKETARAEEMFWRQSSFGQQFCAWLARGSAPPRARALRKKRIEKR